MPKQQLFQDTQDRSVWRLQGPAPRWAQAASPREGRVCVCLQKVLKTIYLILDELKVLTTLMYMMFFLLYIHDNILYVAVVLFEDSLFAYFYYIIFVLYNFILILLKTLCLSFYVASFTVIYFPPFYQYFLTVSQVPPQRPEDVISLRAARGLAHNVNVSH